MLLRPIVLRCMVIFSIEMVKTSAFVSSNHTFDPGEDDKSVSNENFHYETDEKLSALDREKKLKRLSKTLRKLNRPDNLGLDDDAHSGSVSDADLNSHTSFSNDAVDVAEHSGNGDVHIIDDADYGQGMASYGSGASDTSLEEPHQPGHPPNTDDLAGQSSDDLDYEAWRRKIGAEDSVPIVPEDDFGVDFATKIVAPTSLLPPTQLDVTTKNVIAKSSMNLSHSTSLPLTTLDKPYIGSSRGVTQKVQHHRNDDILQTNQPHIGFSGTTTISGRQAKMGGSLAGGGKSNSSSASKMSFKLDAVIRFCLIMALCAIFQFYC